MNQRSNGRSPRHCSTTRQVVNRSMLRSQPQSSRPRVCRGRWRKGMTKRLKVRPIAWPGFGGDLES